MEQEPESQTVCLAIETATSVCSVALLKDDRLLAEASEVSVRRHNERLPGMVEEVLALGGVRSSDIDVVAISIGPGSFTGLRVGLSFAKGFAQGVDARVVPVETLDGLALSMADSLADIREQSTLKLCPMTIARRGESFGRFYRATKDGLEPEGDCFLGDARYLAERLKYRSIIGGEGADALKDELMDCSGEMVVILPGSESSILEDQKRLFYLSQIRASSVAVGRIGQKIWSENRETLKSAGELEPFYLKKFMVHNRKKH